MLAERVLLESENSLRGATMMSILSSPGVTIHTIIFDLCDHVIENIIKAQASIHSIDGESTTVSNSSCLNSPVGDVARGYVAQL